MLRSRRCPPAALLLAALAGAAAGCSREAPARPPDIVLISLDSVRADDLSFLDEHAAPTLAALARRGTVFNQAIAGSSWTLPGHVEMFSGCPPALHGVSNDTIGMDPLLPTLPEQLHARGYRTAGFFTGIYLDPRYGFGRGFDSYEDCRAQGDDDGATPHFFGADTITGPRVAEQVEALLPTVPAEQPLFLFAHIFDPHYDYIPPDPWDRRFDPDYAGDLDGRDYWENRRVYDPKKTPHRQVSDRDLQHLHALYRGEIAFSDASVGRVLAALERAGRLQNAVIIVASDHGEEFFEHDNRGHRNGLFDEVLRVPLLIVPPAGSAPGRVAAVGDQVSLSDIAPTLLDFAGLPAPASVSGRSLRGALSGAALPRRPVYSTLTVSQEEKGTPMLWLTESLRWPESKLLLVSRYDPKAGLRLVSTASYDLRKDPGEKAPVAHVPGDPLIQEQWQGLEDVLDGLRAQYAAQKHTPDAARNLVFRAASDENLRALGYLGTDHAETDPGRLHPPWGLGPRPRQPPPK